MKLLSLLPLVVFSTLAPVFASASEGIPTPYPEAGMFAPSGAVPVPKGHPSWDAVISIDSKGLPLRAVLAAAFESAKVSYAVDPGLDLTIYANVKDVTLREAVAILNKLADFEVRAENNVWYASRRKPKATKGETTTVTTVTVPVLSGSISGGPKTAKPTITIQSTSKTNTKSIPAKGAVSSQTILVDATPRGRSITPMRVTPPATMARTSFPVGKTEAIVPSTIPTVRVAKKPAVKTAPALSRRVTTKMPKADLRDVIDAFSQQTGVAITIEAAVPRYKIDAFMKGCSLKYALDRLCGAAGLKYESHGSAIVISKA